MDNIVNYAETVLDSFAHTPLNAVDSLILSWVSYFHFPAEEPDAHRWQGVRFADLFRAEWFPALFDHVWDPDNSRRLFTALAASPRYRDMRLLGFTEQLDPEEEKQFSALCFQLSPALCYVAFRGTDSTLVGWKEDFNMAFQSPIPSQRDALGYLAETSEHCAGDICVGGHSKGGNLAVYAAANSAPALKARIARVYSHDGPGFLEETLRSEAFCSIRDRLDKTVPQSSLVGILAERQENFRIIKSTRVSFWQHDPFSWVVDGCDFLAASTLTPDALYLDHTLNEWFLSLTRQERELFIDSLYQLVNPEQADTFSADWKNALPSIAQAAADLDPTTRQFLSQTVHNLLSISVRNFPELLPSLPDWQINVPFRSRGADSAEDAPPEA